MARNRNTRKTSRSTAPKKQNVQVQSKTDTLEAVELELSTLVVPVGLKHDDGNYRLWLPSSEGNLLLAGKPGGGVTMTLLSISQYLLHSQANVTIIDPQPHPTTDHWSSVSEFGRLTGVEEASIGRNMQESLEQVLRLKKMMQQRQRFMAQHQLKDFPITSSHAEEFVIVDDLGCYHGESLRYFTPEDQEIAPRIYEALKEIAREGNQYGIFIVALDYDHVNMHSDLKASMGVEIYLRESDLNTILDKENRTAGRFRPEFVTESMRHHSPGSGLIYSRKSDAWWLFLVAPDEQIQSLYNPTPQPVQAA